MFNDGDRAMSYYYILQYKKDIIVSKQFDSKKDAILAGKLLRKVIGLERHCLTIVNNKKEK